MGGAAAGASAGGKEIVTEGISPADMRDSARCDATHAHAGKARTTRHEEAQEIGPQAVKLTSPLLHYSANAVELRWSRLFRQGQHALPPRHAKNAA